MVISLGSTYYSQIRRFDDVLLTVDLTTVFMPSNSEDAILLKSVGPLTFINAGNRPAAIQTIVLSILPRAAKSKEDCENDWHEGDPPVIWLKYEKNEPFVVKAEDIVVRQVEIDHPLAYDVDRNGYTVITINRKSDAFVITTCLVVGVIDSAGDPDFKSVPLTQETVTANADLMHRGIVLTDTKKPVRLLRKVRSIFGE